MLKAQINKRKLVYMDLYLHHHNFTKNIYIILIQEELMRFILKSYF